MKLTARSEYALLALVELARRDAEQLVSAETLADARGIPLKFLEQILLTLKRAGILRSVKGQRGGYRLARPASRITLAEVIRRLDGALAPTESVSRYFYESTPVEKEPGLLAVFRSIRDHIADTLEHTSLADVAKRPGRSKRKPRAEP